MWRGYQSCGEVTQPSVARLPNLWRDYLWRGYLVARLQSGYSPIFRWNQQHFNYILVSVARFLPLFHLNCIGKQIGLCFGSWDAEP